VIDPLIAVTHVKALPGFRLRLRFSDGAEGVFDCAKELWGEVFEPLKDPKYFAKVFLDHGAPSWPNGADLDPAVLRQDTKLVAAVRQSPVRKRPPVKTVAEDRAAYPAKPARRISAKRSS
jgi:hypothetical protein